MFLLSQFLRSNQHDIDKLESGFTELRQARNGQRIRWRGAQLTGPVIVRYRMVIARGLNLRGTRGLMVPRMHARTRDHAGNAQYEFARDEDDQSRQKPRLEV